MISSEHEQRFGRRRVSTLSQVAEVREEFEAWLAELDGDDDRRAEVVIVLSELGANAVEATPENRPPPRVEAWLAESGCTIEVVNHVDEGTAGPAWDLSDPLRAGGRGLLLVSEFADDLEVETTGELLTVRCTAHLSE